MTPTQPLQLTGMPGSPYTRKMLAYLRFRHIRYELLIGNRAAELGLPRPKVELLPTFYLADEQGNIQAEVDSTPLIRRFEQEFAGRSTLPESPVLAFLNYLIEDYADEWLTKPMFHYRWYYGADIDKAGTILPRWRAMQAPEATLQTMKQQFADRQISRLYVVGSNDETAGVIEESYRRFLKIMDGLLQKQTFVLGDRPASADFGIYAQLTQLASFDPTPAAICLAEAPRVRAWTDIVDDLSGFPAEDDAWIPVDRIPSTLGDLLSEIGRVYAPVLIANAAAIQRGDREMSTTIDGRPWHQPVFPYQAKCLHWINDAYQELDSTDRTRIDSLLAGTGCETMLEPLT